MNYEERGYHVQRITVGQTIFEYDGEILYLSNPTPTAKLRAEYIYKQSYNHNEDVISNEDIIIWMIQCKLWDYEREEKLENAYRDMDTLKIGYLESDFNLPKRESIIAGIKKTEELIAELEQERSAYYSNTREGIASWLKLRYLIGSSIYRMDNSLYLSDAFFDTGEGDSVISAAMTALSNDSLNEYQIRELARNEPWLSIWNSSKYCNGIFDCPPSCLSSEQRSLIAWTQTYESLTQRDDLSKDIIDDDYALDGWLIKNARDRSDRAKANSVQNKFSNSQIAQHEHIFVMTGGRDENIQKINAANPRSAQLFKKQYMRDIASVETVEDQKTSFGQDKMRAQAIQGQRSMMKKANG